MDPFKESEHTGQSLEEHCEVFEHMAIDII